MTREAELYNALSLALAMLAPHEPPDSRAVSNEYVAMACTLNGSDDEKSRKVITDALARINRETQERVSRDNAE